MGVWGAFILQATNAGELFIVWAQSQTDIS